MFASRIEATLGAADHDVELASSVAKATGLEGVDLLVVDLDREPAEGVVGLGMPVLGFYAHLNTETREEAEAAGIDLVVPRSRWLGRCPTSWTGCSARGASRTSG